MKKNVFDYKDYLSYFRAQLESAGLRGRKGLLAQHIQVQPTYISQILQGKADLSLEQAELANSFFNHNLSESNFFLLLVQKDRAGTKRLKEHFQNQIEDILKSRLVLVERLGRHHEIDEKERNWYYSSWGPSALHISVTIPDLQTVDALAEFHRLAKEKVIQIMDRLERIGLVYKDGGKYLPGQSQMRLEKNSNHIIQHHSNWRVRALQSLDSETIEEMHYSGVVSLGRKDIAKIKNILLEALQSSIAVVKDSPEEELFCLNFDFFNLKK